MSDSEPQVEKYRPYLHLLARMQIKPAFAAKIDISGIVQQTLFEAVRDTGRAKEEQELLPWLRKLLANNLRDEVRRWSAMRRDVKREQSLEAALEQSSSQLQALCRSQQSSPSQRAIRSEELLRLAAALAALPDDQRLAVELHHLQGLPLGSIARELDRTKEAVASLLYRALMRLKKELGPKPEND